MAMNGYKNVLPADTIKGTSVVNAAGKDLGNIEDVVLDLGSGRVAYAVLSFGGVLGLGDKYFAVPWDALAMDTREDQLILDVPKEKLEDAKGFDKDNWPNMANEEWGSQVYSYYGYEPYWDR